MLFEIIGEYRHFKEKIANIKFKIWYFIFVLMIVVVTISWTTITNGHISESNQVETSTFLRVNQVFETNFSRDQFKDYVDQNQISNYNRVWNVEDYATILPNEVQIKTNLVITTNQTISKCAEHPLFKHFRCNHTEHCKSGTQTPHGIVTGRCIPNDFVTENTTVNNETVHTCEIKGVYFVKLIIFFFNIKFTI